MKHRWIIGGVLLSLLYAASAILLVYVTLGYDKATRYEPLRDPSPQTIAEATVHPGDVIHVTATKCNDSNTDVVFDYRVSWRNVETREAVKYRASDGNVRAVGCTTNTFDHTVPADLPPGKWQLEGTEIARDGEKQQNVGWHTETFEVVGD